MRMVFQVLSLGALLLGMFGFAYPAGAQDGTSTVEFTSLDDLWYVDTGYYVNPDDLARDALVARLQENEKYRLEHEKYRNSWWLEGSGGLDWMPGRHMTTVPQSLSFLMSGTASIAAGIRRPFDNSPIDWEIGAVAEFQHFRPRQVLNDPPIVGSVAIDGSGAAFNVFPRAGIRGPVTEGVDWFVSAGAGISIQTLNATSAGAPVLTGSGVTGMAQIDGGLRFQLGDGVELGTGGFVTFLGPLQTRTSTNVIVGLDPATVIGGLISLRVSMPDERTNLLFAPKVTLFNGGAGNL